MWHNLKDIRKNEMLENVVGFSICVKSYVSRDKLFFPYRDFYKKSMI